MIKVLVVGASGKMGMETVKAVSNADGLSLVKGIDSQESLDEAITSYAPEVVVDFTHPDVVRRHVETYIQHGVHSVIGTTGLSAQDLTELDALAQVKNVGVAVCPNFAIGAILMMKAAADIAKYMDRVEVIESHHDKKADAPSGTALKTVDVIKAANDGINSVTLDEKELVTGARGGTYKGVPIHSVRLPGYVASQDVIFGGLGQRLKLTHDTISRESFMPGVVLAVREIISRTGLIYGLENLM